MRNTIDDKIVSVVRWPLPPVSSPGTSTKISYVWVLLLEHVHRGHQVVVLVRHDDFANVVQQQIVGALHGPVQPLFDGDLLGPRDHLHKALLGVKPTAGGPAPSHQVVL